MALTQEQIIVRKRGVGGSEIMAALGKDPRCSRLELYKRKIGELPELDLSDDPRVHFGTLLEPVLASEFERRIGHQVICPKHTLVHPDGEPLVASPDGWIPALNEGAEFKTADKYEAEEFGEEESDQVPVRYLLQCAAYMTVTKAKRWHLGVLIGGNDFRTYVIPRDEAIEQAVIVGAREFWSHVEQRRPPNPETPEDVRLRWPKDLGTTIVATADVVERCQQLAEAKALLKNAEFEESGLKTQIQRFMEEAAQLVDADGQLLATWRTARASMKLDEKRFEREHPDLHRQYLREVPGSRRFLLKEVSTK